jgi:MFS family permease
MVSIKSIFVELIFAIAVSLFLTVVFAAVGKQAKSWRRVLIFFLIVFFGAWAGGIWLTPIGPLFLGVYWLSFFVVGLVFALILESVAAFSMPSSKTEKAAAKVEVKEEREIESIVGIFIWVLLAVLAGAIVLGYVRRLHP